MIKPSDYRLTHKNRCERVMIWIPNQYFTFDIPVERAYNSINSNKSLPIKFSINQLYSRNWFGTRLTQMNIMKATTFFDGTLDDKAIDLATKLKKIFLLIWL